MASTLNAAACALAATLLWTALGWPLARRLVPPALALAVAPAIGWAVHSAVALAVFFQVPFSAVNVAAVAILTLLVGIAAARSTGTADHGVDVPRVPAGAFAAAAVLAAASAVAILPGRVGDAVVLGAPIYDHAKVALIDDMVRLGLPAGNPFFHHDGGPERLAYYYLWHFSAAELALVLGVSGWEADAAMTWFSAFSSLAVMMAFAVWLSGSAAAAFWVVVLAAAASGRFVLWKLLGTPLEALLAPTEGFAGWLFQSAWVPQHIASATCVLLAIYLMTRLAGRTGGIAVVVLALVVVAGFESSTWIGGIAFSVAATVAAAILLLGAAPEQRLRLVAGLAVAGVLAAALATPFLRDQLAFAALRGGGSPVALHPYEVLGDDVPLRRLLDLPAFWLILLPLEFPAVYVTGSIVLARLLAARKLDPERMRLAAGFAALTAACLGVSSLLASTSAHNNDLGWRALLPAVMALTVMSAVGLSRWIAARARIPTAAAIGAILLGLPVTVNLIRGNLIKDLRPGATLFAAAPDLWAAVRRHAAPDERVANNPLFLSDITLWPVNISWGLMANRRSCFAGRELTWVYTALPPRRHEEIDAQFTRVFAGGGATADIRDLAMTYECRVVVLTAADGAWTSDPFAGSAFYRLVDERPEQWRIYRAAAPGGASR
jgi:hypothetical protein